MRRVNVETFKFSHIFNTKRQIELKPPAAIGGLVTTEATELTKAADNPFGANISKKRE